MWKVGSLESKVADLDLRAFQTTDARVMTTLVMSGLLNPFEEEDGKHGECRDDCER